MKIHTRRPWQTPATIGFAALIAACVGTRTTLAQDSLDDWEWEAGEGYHEEEWYDPSDWFYDDSPAVHYENDDWGWDDDEYDDDAYDYDWDDDSGAGYGYQGVTNDYYDADDYYSSYYDGYYDGYNDDAFGYDDPDAAFSGDDSGSGFVDGYYDGYYDQVEDYDYDPYYYVYVDSSTDRDRNSDRQRMGDRTRERGDRQRAMREQKDARQVDRVADEHRRSAKMRGTVASIRFLQGTGSDRNTPLVARIEMEDGRTGVVNLGPRMNRAELPFSQGDRVTLSGKRTRNNDRQVLMVHSIQANGDTARIASRDMIRRTSNQGRMQQDRQRMQRDDRRMQQDRQRMQRDDRMQNRSSGWEGDARQRVRDEGNSQRNTTLRGEINRIGNANLDSDQYRVFRMAMQDGKQVLVAVPSNRSRALENMDIGSGDRVMVQGERRQVDGRSVLLARRVSVNGERLEVGSD